MANRVEDMEAVASQVAMAVVTVAVVMVTTNRVAGMAAEVVEVAEGVTEGTVEAAEVEAEEEEVVDTEVEDVMVVVMVSSLFLS